MKYQPFSNYNPLFSLVLCIGAILIVSTHTHAEVSKRGNRVPTVVQETQREAKKEESSRPNLEYRDYGIRRIEIKVEQKRRELIGMLDEILAGDPPRTERPDILFQKAELLMEESQFHFFNGMALDDDLSAAEAKGLRSKVKSLNVKKKKELKKSRDWIRKAVILFTEIERDHPDYPRLPDVLFSLGRAYWDAQSYPKALQTYRKIIKEHPKSQYVPDSWLAFGEYYFEYADEGDRNLDKALSAYTSATQFEDSMSYGYALYKKGWVEFNMGRYEDAAEGFKSVVLYSDINSELLGKRKVALAKEARRDYVLAYTRFGSGEAAKNDFKKLSKNEDDLFSMLERAAELYYGDGQDRSAIACFQNLIKMKQGNIRNPVYQGKIVKAVNRIGTKDQVVGQSKRLVEMLNASSERVRTIKPGTTRYEIAQGELEEAERVADNILRSYSTTWHNEAQKTNEADTFDNAQEMYELYLGHFADRKEAYEMRFFYAELLYHQKSYLKAAKAYEQVFLADAKGKWRESAAADSMRAYDQLVAEYDTKEGAAEAQALKDDPKLALTQRKIPEVKAAYVKASQRYVDAYPKGDEAAEAKYTIARIPYGYGHFDEALPGFERVIAEHPKHIRAIQSANLILDTYNVKKDWTTLNTRARKFRTNRTLMKDEELKGNVQKIIEQASFKAIRNQEESGDFKGAAKSYEKYAREFPEGEYSDEALANGASMWVKTGNTGAAIKARKKLLELYPESELVPDQMMSLSSLYESNVEFAKAAYWQEKFADKYPKDPRSQDALLNASIYREGTGDVAGAIKDRKKYIERYKNDESALEAAFQIPNAYERAGEKSKAAAAYVGFAKTWFGKSGAKAIQAQYRAHRLYQGRSKTKAASSFATLKAMVAKYGKVRGDDDLARDAIAFVAFENAESVFKAYKKKKIAKPDQPKTFQRSVKSKQKGREKVIAAYTKVVKIGSPEWAVASLYQAGAVHLHLIEAFKKVPAPRGFNREQSQLFKDTMAEQTYPIEDEAVSAFGLCAKESARFGVSTKYTKKCITRAQELRPDAYPDVSRDKFKSSQELEHKRLMQASGLVIEEPSSAELTKRVQGTAPQRKQRKEASNDSNGGAS